ncbi:HNH endonuclease [Candidatus Babeliales bacterium]|nr:HNH endonuclease [Candidatus Babeliales bacterium]
MQKPIRGYEDIYTIDEKGTIRSIFRRNPIGQHKNRSNRGYVSLDVVLCRGSKCSHRRISRLLYDAFIGEIPKGMVVDHKDRNPANNSLNNLRLATRAQNAWNSKKKGVQKHRGRYRARITVNGKRISLGLYDTEQEAVDAYEKAAKEHHGEFFNACV